jgi:tetratricopeptide (TPR) repeat protein
LAINRDKVLESAQKYVEKKKYDKAVAELRKLVEADPNDARTLLKIGDLQAKQGLHADAISTYESVGKLYSTQGFALKAIAVYKQIREIIAKHVPHLEERYGHIAPKLAELYQQLGLTSDALAALDEVATRLQRQQKDQEAIDVFRRIVELDPTNPLPHLRLAEALSRVRDIEGAVYEFKTAAEQLAGIGRRDDAIKVLERLLHHRPDPEQARQCAELYLSRGQPQDGMQALAKLQICFQANPRDFDTLSLLARAFNAIGQGAKAIEVQKEMARVARDTGKTDLFREILDRLMRVAPHDEGVRRLALNQATNAPPPYGAGPSEAPRAESQRYPQAPPGAMGGMAGAPRHPQGPHGHGHAHSQQGFQSQPGLPQSQPRFPQSQPGLPQSQPRFPQSQPGFPQSQPAFPQSQPAFPQGQPYPQSQQGFPHGQPGYGHAPPGYPQGQQAYPQSQPGYPHGPPTPQGQHGYPQQGGAWGSNAPAQHPQPPGLVRPITSQLDVQRPPPDPIEEVEELSYSSYEEVEEIEEEIDDASSFGEATYEESEAYVDEYDDLETGRKSLRANAYEAAEYAEPAAEIDTAEHVQKVLADAHAFRRVRLYAKALETLRAGLGVEPRSMDLHEVYRDVLIEAGQTEEAVREMLAIAGLYVDALDGESAARALQDVLAFDPQNRRAIEMLQELGYEIVDEGEAAPDDAGYTDESRLPSYDLDADAEAVVEYTEEGDASLPSFPLDEPDADVGLPGQPATAAPPDEPRPAPSSAAPPRPRSSIAAGASRELEDALDEAEFFCSRGLFEDAKAILTEQLSKHPNHPLLRERLSEVDAQAGRRESGARERPRAEADSFDIGASLDALESLDYDSVQPAEGHADDEQQVDVEEVFAKFKEGVAKQISVEDSDSHYNLGIAYKEMSLLDDAINELEIAARDPKFECVCKSMIGMIQIERGKVNEAIEAFLQGLNSSIKDPTQETVLCYEIGAAYEAKKQNKDALSYYQKAMRRDPNYRDVQDRVRRLAKAEPKQNLRPVAVGADDEFDRAFDDLLSKA